MIFTDYYGEQSCTAGRSSYIMGQSVLRTGLSKVGLPGAEQGMRKKDPTIAGLLQAQGFVTGQFGKNHLGDKDEMLPSNHGFDEFFGNLYHLNAEEEPENEDYPKDPEFKRRFGTRVVIKASAGRSWRGWTRSSKTLSAPVRHTNRKGYDHDDRVIAVMAHGIGGADQAAIVDERRSWMKTTTSE